MSLLWTTIVVHNSVFRLSSYTYRHVNGKIHTIPLLYCMWYDTKARYALCFFPNHKVDILWWIWFSCSLYCFIHCGCFTSFSFHDLLYIRWKAVSLSVHLFVLTQQPKHILIWNFDKINRSLSENSKFVVTNHCMLPFFLHKALKSFMLRKSWATFLSKPLNKQS